MNRLLQLIALNCLALAYPLLEVLGKGPELFISLRATPLDVSLFIALLIFAIPVLMLIVETIAKKINPGLGSLFVFIDTLILTSIYFLTLVVKLSQDPGAGLTTLAVALGLITTILYIKFSGFQSFVSILSLLAIVAPLNFFMQPGVKDVFKQEDDVKILSSEEIKKDIPIVFVMFDEFQLSVLLDENDNIDKVRFPHIADFAAHSYWFKNATAVNQFTHTAAPSIATAIIPSATKKLPTYQSYPENLFTWLAGSYKILAHEPFTKLCPDQICNPGKVKTKESTLNKVIADSAAVYMNLAIPSGLGYPLPDVTGNWGNFFEDQEKMWKDHSNFARGSRFKEAVQYVERIRKPNDDMPRLYYSHHILPHMPLQFMPNGDKYEMGASRSYVKNVWVGDDEALKTAYHQYLLNTGAVDNVIGRLIHKLKSLDLYDKSLIIITADHGFSAQYGTYRRGNYGTPSFYEDILSVPMFVKLPNQKEGIVSDRNVQTIDILPTIADVLGTTLPWKNDGMSMFSKDPAPTVKTFFVGENPENKSDKSEYIGGDCSGGGKLVTYEIPKVRPHATRDWKLNLPGYKNYNKEDVFYIGPHAEYLGKKADDYITGDVQGLSFELVNKFFVHKDGLQLVRQSKDSRECPCRIMGEITPVNNISTKQEIAISVNGVLRGFWYPFAARKGKEGVLEFEFFVPSNSFQNKLNSVALYLVDNSDSSVLKLQKIAQTPSKGE